MESGTAIKARQLMSNRQVLKKPLGEWRTTRSSSEVSGTSAGSGHGQARVECAVWRLGEVCCTVRTP